MQQVVRVVRAAGAEVMNVYATEFQVFCKADASPVTLADQRAEVLITARLQQLTPDIAVIGEEAMATGAAPRIGELFWLVDPLDGTKEFINRNGEFTVNVALVQGGRPALGVVHAPALGRLWAGGPGLGSWTEEGGGGARPITCRPPPAEGLTVVASRAHGDAAALDAFLARHRVAATCSMGSSLKLCHVAQGEADVYPRLGRTMEWDIAAGHAVILGAGGAVECLDGSPLTYGKADFGNPHFVAWGLRRAPGDYH